MTKEELQNILTLHAAWLKGESIGKRADLSSADAGYSLNSSDLQITRSRVRVCVEHERG